MSDNNSDKPMVKLYKPKVGKIKIVPRPVLKVVPQYKPIVKIISDKPKVAIKIAPIPVIRIKNNQE